MLDIVGEFFLKELDSLKKSWYKLSLITVLPIVSFILVIAIFYAGVARDMPIAVIDSDNTQLSRKLLTNVDASSTIKIAYKLNSTKEALKLLQNGEVYALLIIEDKFSKDTLLQKHPHITVMLNTQYILIGKILTSALTSTVMQSSAQVEYIKNLLDMQNPYTTMNSISPIGMQVTPFFNTYQNYFYFLVSALIPSILQIFIVITTIVSLGNIFKYKKEKEFFIDNTNIVSKLVGMMLPYTIAFSLIGIIYILYIYSMWEFQGSFVLLVFALFLMVIAYQVIALFLFVTGFDYARALSLGAVYTAPAFAFLGVTFPVYNMNTFAIFWRNLLPVAHYIELQISQANYGVDSSVEFTKLLSIIAFWLLFIPVVYMFKKRLSR